MADPRPRLTDIMRRVRSLADQQGAFVSDDDLKDFINDDYEDLYELLVGKHENYFESEATIPIVAGTSDYALPEDMFKLLAVDILLVSSSSEYYSVRPYNNQQRNAFSASRWDLTLEGSARYQMRGAFIRFIPLPLTAQTCRIKFVPQVARLVSGTDKIPYPMVAGWVRYIIVGAAIRCRMKEETDWSDLGAEKARLEARIEKSAANRDANEPQRISDAAHVRDCYDEDWI
jgi:hypothetical protein